ncbi:MAG: (d)CMP kinase [Clostridia bacterium]|nr:(d)CMP kinase [Clostridia bacterium]
MEKKRKIRIAIDGPGGAGKSSVAREVAQRRGFIYVDTGALYRAVGLFVARRGIATDDKAAIIACLPEIDIAFIPDGDRGIMTLCGEDVGGQIRTPEVSLYASAVSAIPEVREALLDLQKKFAEEGGVVMDGRDIGTVIIPDAELKLFLTASPEVRARRRFLELEEKGTPQPFEDVLADIIKRDEADSNRKIAPLKPADDSIVFVNDEYDLEQTICYVLGLIDAVEHIYGREN